MQYWISINQFLHKRTSGERSRRHRVCILIAMALRIFLYFAFSLIFIDLFFIFIDFHWFPLIFIIWPQRFENCPFELPFGEPGIEFDEESENQNPRGQKGTKSVRFDSIRFDSVRFGSIPIVPMRDCRVKDSILCRNRNEPNRIEANRIEPNRFGSFLASGTAAFGFLIKFYTRFIMRELKRTVLESFGTKLQVKAALWW